MTNYREILRLFSLGLNKTQIAEICGYSRNTVAQTIKQAEANGLKYPLPEGISDTKLAEIIRPNAPLKVAYKMPDYAYVAREMLKSNVTLNLLWLEYAEECKENGEIPYQLTQFKNPATFWSARMKLRPAKEKSAETKLKSSYGKNYREVIFLSAINDTDAANRDHLDVQTTNKPSSSKAIHKPHIK